MTYQSISVAYTNIPTALPISVMTVKPRLTPTKSLLVGNTPEQTHRIPGTRIQTPPNIPLSSIQDAPIEIRIMLIIIWATPAETNIFHQ